jgi:hypothetical protein
MSEWLVQQRMKIRVQLDDDLVRTAQDYCGEKDLSQLVSKALNALIFLKSENRAEGNRTASGNSSPARN